MKPIRRDMDQNTVRLLLRKERKHLSRSNKNIVVKSKFYPIFTLILKNRGRRIPRKTKIFLLFQKQLD